MNPIEAVASFFGNYFKFSGRATRSEYWWCNLIIALAYIILVIVMVAMPIVGNVLYFVMIIAIFIPLLALSVRRLHDTNRSGLWLLLGFVPFGGIVLLIFFVLPSTVGSNNYGSQSLGSLT